MVSVERLAGKLFPFSEFNLEMFGDISLSKAENLSRLPDLVLLHNVYIVQYVFLPTEQSETSFKIFILIFDSTYICPDLFDWKENTFFSFLCISNSKSAISLII